MDKDKLPLDDAAVQAQYIAEAQKAGIVIDGSCLDILHVNYLKNDKLGQKWVADGIGITKKLNARVMLMPFFGKGALATREEMNYVGDVLKEPERAGRMAQAARALARSTWSWAESAKATAELYETLARGGA